MSVQLALFVVFGGLAVAAAISLVLQRQPIHSAISLIVVMVSLAALYLLLAAEFIAAVQIIVYAGAIMVLFVFVIMLLNAGREERTNLSRMARYVGLPVGAVLTAELAYWIYRAAPQGMLVDPNRFIGRAESIGRQLFREYVLPFELTSILILIAILGAVVLTKKEL
jgi:NADH-quinone oxidoreductase subunit J